MYERNIWLLGILIAGALALALFATEIFLSPSTVGLAGPVQQGTQYEDDEPNDTISNAEAFNVPGIMRGTIEAPNDVDCFEMFFSSLSKSYELTIYDSDDVGLDLELFDSGEALIATLSTSDSSSSARLTWDADESFFYVCLSPAAALSADAAYRLTVVEVTVPTDTPTPTNTQTPYPAPSDGEVEEEPNDNFNQAIFLELNEVMYGAIAGIYDQDFYYIESTPGLRYRVILNDWQYDRRVEIYDEDGNYMDSTTTASSSRAELTFTATDARHYLGIFKSSTASSEGTTVDYDVRVYQLQPTPTATSQPTNTPGAGTPTPAPTWPSGYDDYEPNFNFETASTIAPGVTYELNFMPWGGSREPDNDYFKMWVKPGIRFTCETFDLGPVVDTNLIFYDADRNAIGGNDDRTLGDYSSKFSYYSTYEGWLYVLVGTGSRMSYEDAKNSPYKLRCEKSVPGEPTTSPDDNGPSKAPTPLPTDTPRPTATSSSPLGTPTPGEGNGNGDSVTLSFRPLTTPPPLSATPTPSGFRTFRVVIYYDENADGALGAGEGVPGFYVRVVEGATDEELARGYTDEQGQLSFSVPTVGTVRVVVPLLGLDRLVDPSTPELKIRVAPMPLPDVIP